MTTAAAAPRFAPGDRVRVLALYPPGHCRAPFYARGGAGAVLALADRQPDPERLAYGRDGPPLPVYRVGMALRDLWPGYEGDPADRVVVDVWEPWLEPAADGDRS